MSVFPRTPGSFHVVLFPFSQSVKKILSVVTFVRSIFFGLFQLLLFLYFAALGEGMKAVNSDNVLSSFVVHCCFPSHMFHFWPSTRSMRVRERKECGLSGILVEIFADISAVSDDRGSLRL